MIDATERHATDNRVTYPRLTDRMHRALTRITGDQEQTPATRDSAESVLRRHDAICLTGITDADLAGAAQRILRRTTNLP